MSNNRIIILSVFFTIFLSGTGFLSGRGGFPVPAFAQQPAPVSEQPAPAVSSGPLTVTDVIVDKTDKNAVVARDQAIIEAQRAAFGAVAAKVLSPDALKAFKMPDDKIIMALVQDFEIKSEQLSANRYVGNFTIRFTAEIGSYLSIPEGMNTVVAGAAPASAPAGTTATTAFTATTAVSAAEPSTTPTTPRNILVLPYFEDAGKKVLWEDPNPWRDAWQEAGSSAPAPNVAISVPLGDLMDVSSGDTNAVWKGDYGTIEKSRANYNASEVALVVAHQAAGAKGIDIYLYKDGKLARKKSVPWTYNDPDSFKQGIDGVIAALKSPQPFQAGVLQAPPPVTAVAAAVAPAPETQPLEAEKPVVQQKGKPEKITIGATMNFGSFSQWMEAQKRLATINPPLSIEISSLTKDSVRFTIAYDGGLEAFRTALAGKGLALNQPVVEVDEAVLGSDKPTQKTVYELSLLN